MPTQHEFRHADEVGSEDVINSWNEAAEEFASFYSEGEEFYHKHFINPSVIDLLGEVDGKTILDLACGEGHFARNLVELTKGNIKILGVDASENMIRIAREKSLKFKDRLSFQLSDACDLAQIQLHSFDIAVCNMALMDIKDYTQAIREVSRVLKAKGVFIFSILHPCFMTPRSDWVKDENDNIIGWKVDDYHLNLTWKWTIKSRMKMETYHFHRTLEDYFSALRACGFVVTDIREPKPSKELFEIKPRLVFNLKRADFLVVKSVLLNGLL
jgi:ubiquinone/menaquinone biosynthesis C-methylase UbiE